MIIRALDSNHDWTWGRGRNNYLRMNNAVIQNIDTRLNSFLGDCFFDLEAGIDWFNLLGSTNQLALKLAISAVIINTENVTALLELSSVIDENRRITIQYEVTTVYSTRQLRGQITVPIF